MGYGGVRRGRQAKKRRLAESVQEVTADVVCDDEMSVGENSVESFHTAPVEVLQESEGDGINYDWVNNLEAV